MARKKISDALRAALKWQVVLCSGDVTPSEKEAFDNWLQADIVNKNAWNEVEQFYSRIQTIPTSLATQVLHEPVAKDRRHAARIITCLSGVAITAYMARNLVPIENGGIKHRTATGEQSQIYLSDGSHLTLNTKTSVSAQFSSTERRLSLSTGEVFVQTAEDNSRPFIVETVAGYIQTSNSSFSIRQDDNFLPSACTVEVYKGTVEVCSNSLLNQQIPAGMQWHFGENVNEKISALPEHADSWVKGLLIAEGMLLSKFLAEISRYRTGIIRHSNALRSLRISGVFYLHDVDAILRSLQEILPVKVIWHTRYWINVVPI